MYSVLGGRIMNGTKFVVIKFKELVKTVVFAILGVIIIVGLIYFFLPKDSKEDASVYRPGTYSAQFTLNGETAELEIVVDEKNIKSVSLLETPESIAVFYPLVETTAKEIGEEIVKQQSTAIDVSSQNTYTAQIILNAVEKGLEQAAK